MHYPSTTVENIYIYLYKYIYIYIYCIKYQMLAAQPQMILLKLGPFQNIQQLIKNRKMQMYFHVKRRYRTLQLLQLLRLSY